MRQIIFSNGDIKEISQSSNHLYIVFENVTQEELLTLLNMDKTLWNNFTIRRTTSRDVKDFAYQNHNLDHIEFDNNNNVIFLLYELTEDDLNKQALEILLGGAK